MPVGVPKVPFRLYRDRNVFLFQDIEALFANQITGIMVFLNLEDTTRDMFLYICSMGGTVIDGMGIVNMVLAGGAPVHTTCVGIAASMAAFILVCGKASTRTAFPNAWVMIHEPACSLFLGKSAEVFIDIKEMKKLFNDIVDLYAQKTGLSGDDILKEMQKDTFMTATEAKMKGFVDLIGSRGTFWSIRKGGQPTGGRKMSFLK
uniref:ATP-dependent Clp protease proteolytic subunit 1 n=1 Tax=Striga asiatica TaxID=4170 RepID=UPI0021FCD826|nr:ATP-dependent Clp protease proteolytic subunit 1 [Striga asiatica]UXL88525.1 ATP-dependent Clp protease proteolytic subunit 1 [Striga asiatica]